MTATANNQQPTEHRHSAEKIKNSDSVINKLITFLLQKSIYSTPVQSTKRQIRVDRDMMMSLIVERQ